MRGARPAARNASHSPAVRRSCHTMAFATGRPVARSQSTVVSRWLVMPRATMSCTPMPALAIASCSTPDCVAQISIGSCSTHPGCGKMLAEFLLCDRAHVARVIEHERAGAGGSLVEGEDEGHGASRWLGCGVPVARLKIQCLAADCSQVRCPSRGRPRERSRARAAQITGRDARAPPPPDPNAPSAHSRRPPPPACPPHGIRRFPA